MPGFQRRAKLSIIPLISAALALALSACGDDPSSSDGSAGASHPQATSDGLQHIHGLGMSGDRLLIATHSGLWSAPEGQTKARRIGTSRQDVMGFSVLSNGQFIGSGHPDPSQDLPPNLGLIKSANGGKSWKNVSLEGKADFHVLESSGASVYGFDGTQGRLMVSADRGRSWKQRTPPAAMFSLAIDPSASDHLIASTERGLFESRDSGKTFRALSIRQQLTGLLVWPAKDRLFLVDSSGQVSRSSDGGRSWQPTGSIGGQPAAFRAHRDELYAALADSTVKRSTDGGKTWTVRATP